MLDRLTNIESPTPEVDALPAAVSVEAVSRVYETGSEPVWAVRDVTLAIPTGSFVCLFGPSGSGKSTLLNLLAGLDLPTIGSVRVFGRPIEGDSEDERARMRLHDVGVIFQDHHLIEEFTAVENVMLPLEARGVCAAEARKQACAQLTRVGLSGLEERPPAKLSGGQAQRVGIARALAGGRRLLLADEPTGALDSANSTALFKLLRDLCDSGTTVVLATHELASQDYADAVFVMRDGRLDADAVQP